MSAVKQARTLGESAGNAALAKANRCDPDFSARFMALIRMFAIQRRYRPWTAETFRLWAYDRGLSKDCDARASGPLIKKAVRDGLIINAGYAPTVSSRGSVRATYTRS